MLRKTMTIKHFYSSLVLLFLSPHVFSFSGPSLYSVDYTYSDVEAVNIRNIQAMGYGSGIAGMEVNKFYHFKFADGTVVRFKFITKFSTIKFRKSGEPVYNVFSERGFAELLDQLNMAYVWMDSAGGVSTVGYHTFIGQYEGYIRNGRVIIRDLPPREPL